MISLSKKLYWIFGLKLGYFSSFWKQRKWTRWFPLKIRLWSFLL